MREISSRDMERAASAVYAAMQPTLARAWPLLREMAGCEVWVKHENHTPTGSFKVRGGLNLLARVMEEESPPPGLITATRGNHGQSIPFAASLHGMPVVVVAPRTNSPEKNAAMRALGAELIEHGENFDEARALAEELARERGLRMISPFTRELVAGVATAGLELHEQAGELDAIYVSIGMGSGICAQITAREHLGAKTEVVGVVAAGAPAYLESFRARRPVSAPARTFADGMAVGEPHPWAVEVINTHASRIITVSDDEIAEAIRLLWRATHNLAEGSGAAAFAAILKERERLAGKRVACILTGGNLDTRLAAQVLSGETPAPF